MSSPFLRIHYPLESPIFSWCSTLEGDQPSCFEYIYVPLADLFTYYVLKKIVLFLPHMEYLFLGDPITALVYRTNVLVHVLLSCVVLTQKREEIISPSSPYRSPFKGTK